MVQYYVIIHLIKRYIIKQVETMRKLNDLKKQKRIALIAHDGKNTFLAISTASLASLE